MIEHSSFFEFDSTKYPLNGGEGLWNLTTLDNKLDDRFKRIIFLCLEILKEWKQKDSHLLHFAFALFIVCFCFLGGERRIQSWQNFFAIRDKVLL